MERLKKTNQTMLAVVGFLTAIIPAFTFAEKLYNGNNLVLYSHWFLHSQESLHF